MTVERNTPAQMRDLERIVRKAWEAIESEGVQGFAIAVVIDDRVISSLVGGSPEAVKLLVDWAPTSMKDAIERMLAGIVKGTVIK